MCNLSEGVFREGYDKGFAQGFAQGFMDARLEILRNIILATSTTFEKAATALKIPEDEWEEYRSKL
jgi:flagellar biosynthesis/type III secretory pathway protein FliH